MRADPRSIVPRTPVPPLREVTDRAVLAGLRWLAASVAAMYFVFIAFNAGSLGARAVQIETALDLLVMAFMGGLLVALRRDVFPERWANQLMLAVGVVVLTNILLTTFVGHDSLSFMPFVIIAAGSFLLSTHLLLLWVLLVSGVSLWTRFMLHGLHGFADYLVAILAGIVLSFAIHAARMRYQRQTHALRVQDAETAEQLAQSQRMEAIGQLAGGVAHDMNNVLGAVMAIASVMRAESDSDDPRRRDIDQILEAARRGSSLTRNLLGFARRGQMSVEPLRLERVVDQVLKLLERTIPKGIRIESRVAQDVPRIQGDAGQLSQVVMNLCLNAVDAMEGRGRLALEVDTVAGPPAQVRLVVQDDGAGMTPEVAQRAFEPFYTTKAAGKGTGLGLAMVFGAIKSHGGDVSLHSRAGQGTAVTILIPALPAEPADTSVREASHPSVPGHPSGCGLVLVVDDEPMIRSSLSRILIRQGFEVSTAENGAEALDLYRDQQHRIRLVLLDLAMPVMDGIECFRRLRALDPGVKVLVVSGYSAAEDAAEVLAAANGFVRKPFDLDEIQATVHAILGDEPTRPQP